MLNKKDPLIDAIQQVMQSNQADRDAVKAVNEKFGIQDRRVLPRERQGEWDAAYQTVLSEEMSPKQRKLAAVGKNVDPNDNPKTIGRADLEGARKGHASHIEEEEKMKGDDPCWKNYKMVGMKKKSGKPVPNCVPVKEQDYSATQPSKMGLKPDYATGTPDYAKSKEQTPNRADKTSLPAGTMKEEEQIDEAGMIPKKGTIKRFLTGLKAKREARKAEKKAYDDRGMMGPGPNFTKDAGRMQSMTKVAKRLGEESRIDEGGMEKTMREFKRGTLHSGSKTGPIVKSRDQAIAIGMNNEETVSENFPKFSFGGMPRQDAAGRARKDRSDMPGTGPGQGSGAPQSRTADGKGSLPPGVSSSPKPQTVAGGKTDLPSGTTSANNNAPPAVGGARPSVVAKNSYSGAQKSTGNQVGGARPSVVAKNSPSQKTYQSGAGAMTNPTQRPYDAKTSPTAKAPVPTSKPTGGSAGSKVKPGVTKLKPVRKQPNAGAVQRPNASAKPKRPLTRYQRDAGIAGE